MKKQNYLFSLLGSIFLAVVIIKILAGSIDQELYTLFLLLVICGTMPLLNDHLAKKDERSRYIRWKSLGITCIAMMVILSISQIAFTLEVVTMRLQTFISLFMTTSMLIMYVALLVLTRRM